ncbi:hypothetical protein PENSUB_5913 [Penicillium subrubescens]|uniref:Uncharacterized protein n=1 Tax=Penicillium subrubescens TaxID=1316194 RepID=A0A1Q5UCR0_9EURO|nr:hypothetical protein PENSUB_5167 [Penicillium subrubescens]OKP10267.1 hypothetical protein PENSUB_4313 [Penicillium subrubescens]OKP10278.1 hypothetical protein PENSUB_4298 [Penicillium subrubescens]OKP14849.1 hypothetical protein PENSUB_5913 [Penicillium subrubescens]
MMRRTDGVNKGLVLQHGVMRTADDEAIFFVSARPARFVVGLVPWNDWHTEPNRPGGDSRTQLMRRSVVLQK